MNIERRSAGEVRNERGRLSGRLLRYGDISESHQERFERGALVLDDVVSMNLFHDEERAIAWKPDGGLTIETRDDEVMLMATLPPIPAATRALDLVRSGEATGLSVEFHARQERRQAGLRVITDALLTGVGLVRAPSYEQSQVEVRRRRAPGKMKNPWGQVQYQIVRAAYCECQDNGIVQVAFDAGAFKEAVESPREILAIAGDASRAVASKRRGTLSLSQTDDGALDIRLAKEAAETPGGKELIETSRAVDIYARPIIDNEKSEFTDEGKVRKYKSAFMRGILLKPSANADGWTPLRFSKSATRSRSRRSLIWL